MTRPALTILCFSLLAVGLAAAPASASEPIVVLKPPTAESIARSAGGTQSDREPSPGGFGWRGDGVTSAPATNEPSTSSWIIPFVVDGGNGLGITTLMSVTNESELPGPFDVDVEFNDALGNQFHAVTLSMGPGELQSFNLRDQPNVPPGVSFGFVEVFSDGDALPSVDFYLVTAEEDFASGDVGFLLDELCSRWRARVLIGGPFTGGTDILFLVNGGRGSEIGDPPTVSGTAYDESGTPINSFDIFTDLSVFEFNAVDLITPNQLFGYIELTIDSELGPPFGGYVFTNVGAEGRYSVGTSGICRDSVPVP